jgi:hypothetical protein
MRPSKQPMTVSRNHRASLIAGALLTTLLLALGATPSLAAEKPLKLKPATLKLATAGERYSQTIGATGGTGPYSFALESGLPPEGITLDPSGELAGTPTTAGSSTFTVQATDSSTPALSASKTYTLPVQLDVEPSVLRKRKAGGSVYVPLSAAGGAGSYEFTLASGALPEGVQLESQFGNVLNGVLFRAGTYTFALQAKDKSTGLTGTRTYKWKIALNMSAEGGAQPQAAVAKPYFATANVVGGSGDYSYEITEGVLPEGLVLGQEQTSATFSGTPQKAGKSRFTLTGTDIETGETVAAKYSLTVRSIAFPTNGVELEEEDKEGNFRGRDFVFFQITHEAKGLVRGTMEDGDGSTGKWTYDTATDAISFDWPEISGSEGFPFSGTCDQAGETCSGTQPFGTFTLARPKFE